MTTVQTHWIKHMDCLSAGSKCMTMSLQMESKTMVMHNVDGEVHEGDNGGTINEDNQTDEDVIVIDNDIDDQMDGQYGSRSGRHQLRPRKPRDYSHLHTVLEGTVMTKMNMKKGIKVFGQDGFDAVLKELQQLHDHGVLEPKHDHELSTEDKKRVLQYLMFLKKKRNGTIKGRGCADGRPTVSIESVMLTSVIDAAEGRDVATVDIPGAFMQADMDDTVHMKLEGTMVDLLLKIAPDTYQHYVIEKNGKKVIYFLLKKALYGTLKAALLFWKRLSSQLQSWGFIINPNDTCVANKMINGSQCTII
jgi:hypothetical protein